MLFLFSLQVLHLPYSTGFLRGGGERNRTVDRIHKEMGIGEHLTYLLRNLYAGQEATVRNRHGIMNGFKTENTVHNGYILSPCLFNLPAEYIMVNARLHEA